MTWEHLAMPDQDEWRRFAYRWRVSDEWFADFIDRCESQPSKKARVKREGVFVYPEAVLRARAWDVETEQKRRWLRRQWDAA